jgi:hypothetical protein
VAYTLASTHSTAAPASRPPLFAATWARMQPDTTRAASLVRTCIRRRRRSITTLLRVVTAVNRQRPVGILPGASAASSSATPIPVCNRHAGPSAKNGPQHAGRFFCARERDQGDDDATCGHSGTGSLLPDASQQPRSENDATSRAIEHRLPNSLHLADRRPDKRRVPPDRSRRYHSPSHANAPEQRGRRQLIRHRFNYLRPHCVVPMPSKIVSQTFCAWPIAGGQAKSAA